MNPWEGLLLMNLLLQFRNPSNIYHVASLLKLTFQGNVPLPTTIVAKGTSWGISHYFHKAIAIIIFQPLSLSLIFAKIDFHLKGLIVGKLFLVSHSFENQLGQHAKCLPFAYLLPHISTRLRFCGRHF